MKIKSILLVIAVIFLSIFIVEVVNAESLFFDGNSFVEIADDPLLSVTGSFTVEAWILPHDTITRRAVISKYLNVNNKDWGLLLASGKFGFEKETWSLPDCQRGNWYVWSSDLVSVNEWTHVAFVIDDNNSIVNVFVNGVFMGSRDLPVRCIPDTSAVVWFGGPGPSYYPENMFIGHIDEVRIWNVARSETELLNNMLTGSITGYEIGLVGYWDFEPGEDTSILYDKTENHLNGNISGASWSDENAPPFDTDDDGILDDEDNCPDTPNGPDGGTCINGDIGQYCSSNVHCGTSGFCSLNQDDYDGDNIGDVCDADTMEDNYPPPNGNNCVDACECEADFNYDGAVTAADVTTFLDDYGRNQYYEPCTIGDPCNGDFDCDGNVAANDVTKFLEDFGRNTYNNPCPINCQTGPWCSY